MKNIIKEQVANLTTELDGCTLEDAIKYLSSFKTSKQLKNKGLYDSYIIETKRTGWDSENELYLVIFGVHEETDEEFNDRVKKDNRNKIAGKASRRKQYETLKREFEND